MRLVLAPLILGPHFQKDLSHQEYVGIAKARSDLTFLVAIEQKFDIALENHFELEREITSVAARDMLFSDYSNDSLWDIGNTLNRRVLNTLSSFRTYIDHTDHHLSDVFGSLSTEREQYKNIRRFIYDSRIEYRAIDALRNYVQHRDLSVHKWSIGSRKIGDIADPGYEYRVGMRLVIEALETDGGFKKKILEELKTIGESIDLIWLIRGYVEAISEINKEVRSIASNRADEVRIIITDAVKSYQAVSEDEDVSPGLAIAKFDDAGICVEHHYLVPEALAYRDRFLNKNRTLINFSKRHVASTATFSGVSS